MLKQIHLNNFINFTTLKSLFAVDQTRFTMDKKTIVAGITQGDINGIGYEIISEGPF